MNVSLFVLLIEVGIMQQGDKSHKFQDQIAWLKPQSFCLLTCDLMQILKMVCWSWHFSSSFYDTRTIATSYTRFCLLLMEKLTPEDLLNKRYQRPESTYFPLGSMNNVMEKGWFFYSSNDVSRDQTHTLLCYYCIISF